MRGAYNIIGMENSLAEPKVFFDFVVSVDRFELFSGSMHYSRKHETTHDVKVSGRLYKEKNCAI
ncbi:unnamed protein product [Clavelina lepadiformis]|uniref:Uncharacterized protein n=1 Tax=Clavelina lepadiformis TaxID=159417 RepID=A0ABP0FP29_CLALP